MKNLVIILLTLGAFSDAKSQELFRFGFLIGVDNSYFNYGDLGFAQIPPDGSYGGKFGFNYIFNITDHIVPRAATTYTYQTLSQQYSDDLNEVSIDFQNHYGSLELIPIAVKFGGLIKGGLSAGAYFNYLLYNTYTMDLNGSAYSGELEFNRSDNGLLFGIDLYIKDVFLELRFMTGKKQFVISGSENTINQVQFILNL